MARGRVLRFDQVKGYGFIAPEGGGEDVFLHANDLLTPDKHLLGPGALVEYNSEHGDRGAKAAFVQILAPAPGTTAVPAIPTQPGEPATRSGAREDDEFVDVLPQADFQRELTEILLTVSPPLTGPQVLAVREQLVRQCRKYGWVTAS